MPGVAQQWTEYTDPESDELFYFNPETRVSAWAVPQGSEVVPPAFTNDQMPPVPTEFAEGTLVWVPDEDEVCNPAVVRAPFAPGHGGQISFLTESMQQQVAAGADTNDSAFWEGKEEISLTNVETAALLPMEKRVLDGGVNDLITLDELNECAILHKLRMRFADDAIYTNVSSVLISVNPFKSLPLYSDDIKAHFLDPDAEQVRQLPPHIWAVGRRAYRAMRDDQMSQSILVSGESGAGKTEATKYILQYLADASSQLGGGGDSGAAAADASGQPRLEKQILDASPVLEAFGNAKTVRNNNSSRFGKLVSVQFDGSGRVAGARIANYLLEKSRVVGSSEGERNYHIFYQMLASSGSDELTADGLGDEMSFRSAGDYTYLDAAKTASTDIAGVSDATVFAETVAALHSMQLGRSQCADMYRMLSAVLLVGQTTFSEATDAGGTQTTTISRDGADSDSFARAAQLLGVDEAKFEKAICYRKITTRGETFESPNNAVAAGDAKDAFVKKLYANLFDWIVGQINVSLTQGSGGATVVAPEDGDGGGEGERSNWIRVLDIFGFECFDTNSFEQLCINYCNEKLHFFFNEHIFKLEQAEYERQGIDVPTIEFEDNAPTLHLIDAPRTGLMSMIDEEVRLPGGSDEGYLRKVISSHTKQDHKLVQKTDVRKANSQLCFTVVHFAGPVWYNVTNFLEKNKDAVPDDIAECLATSSRPFVQLLMSEDESSRAGFKRRSSLTGADRSGASEAGDGAKAPSAGRAKKAKKASLGAKFKQQMGSLMDTLATTEPHFVRTIKPNSKQTGGIFEASKVLFQLRCNGLMEVCKIRQVGYPVRLSFDEFLTRYRHLLTDFDGDIDALCNGLNRIGALQRDQWAKGNSKIFMRVRSMFRLDHWEEICAHAIKIVQHFGRGAVELSRYRSYKQTLHKLSTALEKHDYESTQEAISECSSRLPGGGKHTAQVVKANSMLPQLKKEHAAKVELRKATEKRKLKSIEKAIAAAEKMNEPTLNASEEMAAAKRMIELLEKEEGLKRALREAIDGRLHIKLRDVLAESEGLGLVGAEIDDARVFMKGMEDVKAKLAEASVSSSDPGAIDVLLARAASEYGVTAESEIGSDEVKTATTRSNKLKQVIADLSAATQQHDVDKAKSLLDEAKKMGISGDIIAAAEAFEAQVRELAEKLAEATKVGDIEQIEALLASAKDQGMDQTAEFKAASKAKSRINDMRHALREACDTKNKMRLKKLIGDAEEMGLETSEVVDARRVLLTLEIQVAVKQQDSVKIEALLEKANALGEMGDVMAEAGKCKAQLDLKKRIIELTEEIEANRGGGDLADGSGTGDHARAELTEAIKDAGKLDVGDVEEVTRARDLITALEFEDTALAQLRDAVSANSMALLADCLHKINAIPSLVGTDEVKRGEKLYAELMTKYQESDTAQAVEGYLQKLGAKHRAFRKRYLVLKDMQLKYYKNESSYKKAPQKPKGILPLNTVSSVIAEEDPDVPVSFKLVTPTRTWLFKAAAEDDRQRWAGEIRNNALAAVILQQQKDDSTWATRHQGVVQKNLANKKTQAESKIITIDTISDMASRPAVSSSTKAELERIRAAAAESFAGDDTAEIVARHGTLFTGQLLVKQDLETFENLYKPSNWRAYFFVLSTSSTMYVFEDQRCRALIGWVLITPDSTVYPTSLGPNSFQVVTPYLVAHLDSEYEAETLKWIRAITSAAKKSPADHLPEPILRAARKIALQENMYDVEFKEKKPLGMKLKPKTKRWAIVTAAKPDSSIAVGSVLARVDGEDVHKVGYHHVVSKLKSWQPPLCLTFRSPPKGGGFLLQRTPTSKKWKMRFLDLHRGALQLFSTDEVKGAAKTLPTDQRYEVAILKEFLDLEGACIRMLPRSEIGKDWCFLLVGGTGTLTLQAQDEHEMVDWCSMLHYAASMANTGDFVIDALANADETQATEAAAEAQARQRAIQMMAGGGQQNIFEGHLHKLALGVRHKRRIRSWKKRYFALQQEGEFFKLAYYADKDMGVLKGTVDLNLHMQVDVSDMRDHSFRLYDHTTEIVLQAPSDELRTQWMEKVNKSVQQLKSMGVGTRSKVPVKQSKRGSVFTFDNGATAQALAAAAAGGGR